MSATTQLLQRYKDFKGLRSNYAAAKALEISESTISGWLAGGTMDDATALQIAQEIGSDPLATLAAVALDRPLRPRQRRVWERYRARVPVALLAALATGLGSGQDAKADATVPGYSASLTTYTLCAVRIGRRAIAAIQTALRACRIQWLRPLPIETV